MVVNYGCFGMVGAYGSLFVILYAILLIGIIILIYLWIAKLIREKEGDKK